MIYFTADLHLGHARIINYCHRPFKSAEEMDTAILANLYSTLNRYDTLYILGDISMSPNHAHRLLSLNKKDLKIHLIVGNHDRLDANLIKRFDSVSKLKDININGQKITLCHYAMRTWNCSAHGAWQLFGHSHGNLVAVGKQMDVGVDTHNFMPYSFDEICEVMKTRGNNEDEGTKSIKEI